MIHWNGLCLGVRIMLFYMMMLETPELKLLFEQIYLEYHGLTLHVAYVILDYVQPAVHVFPVAFTNMT